MLLTNLAEVLLMGEMPPKELALTVAMGAEDINSELEPAKVAMGLSAAMAHQRPTTPIGTAALHCP